jgi:menaquinone-dependent protoporphyrinogen oxidase
MRIAAIYGSNYGQAEQVVRRIAEILQTAGHDVRIFPGNRLRPDFTLAEFDAVVVGASIILGRYQGYIRRFVRRHAEELNRLPSAFVSINGHTPESSPEWRHAARGYVDRFQEATGWQPAQVAMFAGALRYTRYGPLTRWIMKQISRRTGGPTDTSRDYEATDWAAVHRFGHRLAAAWSDVPQPA